MVDVVGRVFAAVALPSEIRLALAERLSDLHVPGRPVPPENWHITLRFLDTVDRVTYERFLSALEPLGDHPSFRVSLDGFGAFPNARRATVSWAGVGRGATEIATLNEGADEAASAAGISPEERPFHPHVTLSRIRPPADARPLLEEDLDLGWSCDRIVVFRSHLGRGGASYEPLDSVDLNR